MSKRYGITNNPERREQELKNQFFGFGSFKVEKTFSNQKSAQRWENTKRNQQAGGPKTSGPIYGYSHEYTRRKPQK